jgi:hypothetical protein
MTEDTHTELVKAFLQYIKANDAWEVRQSHRSKQTVRREIRRVTALLKVRTSEIQQTYKEVVGDIRKNQKWQKARKHPYT